MWSQKTQQRIIDVCVVSSVIGAFALIAIRNNLYALLGGFILLLMAVPGIIISLIISIRAPSRLSLLRRTLLFILALVVWIGVVDSIVALRSQLANQ